MPSVVAELDAAGRDALAQAIAAERPGTLGERAARDFVLRHVFGVVPELIREPADLLQVLLRRHYHGQTWPTGVDAHLIQLLQRDERWADWPLADILPDRSAFLAFTQERWPRFLRHAAATGGQIADEQDDWGWRYKGVPDLPFDAPGVREYVDNLFTEGLLTPSDVLARDAAPAPWMTVGIVGRDSQDDLPRYRRLVDALDSDLPDPGASHLVWVATAHRWAEVVALRWRLPTGVMGAAEQAATEALHGRLEGGFSEWMVAQYASLASRSYLPHPVMTHQIAPYLEWSAEQAAGGRTRPKQALLVVDGLALDQWVTLRDDTVTRLAVQVHDGALFTWVPSITSVARQAIFAGRAPFYFAATIDTTQKDEAQWRRFWQDQGAAVDDVGFANQGEEPDPAFLARVRQLAEHPKRRILGLVMSTVDRSVHGSVLGTGGLHATIRHWVRQGAFRDLLQVLIENDYEVFVTADHGNVECTGIGTASVGTVPDERGRRALVFRDDAVRSHWHARLPDTVAWPPAGLPDDYLPLLAAGRGAFVPVGARTVTHGGIALEEVVVPFARVAAAP